jgi:hypothetical protein
MGVVSVQQQRLCREEDCDRLVAEIHCEVETVKVGDPPSWLSAHGLGPYKEVPIRHHFTEICEAGHLMTYWERVR